jgi:hypothetical protein
VAFWPALLLVVNSNYALLCGRPEPYLNLILKNSCIAIFLDKFEFSGAHLGTPVREAYPKSATVIAGAP